MPTQADKHELRWCCGTTCDATANYQYVKDLERKLALVEAERDNLKSELYILTRGI